MALAAHAIPPLLVGVCEVQAGDTSFPVGGMRLCLATTGFHVN